MTHEPECPTYGVGPVFQSVCMCEELRAAYQRGREDAAKAVGALGDYPDTAVNLYEAIRAARWDSAE